MRITELFRLPTPITVAKRELEHAQRSHLQAQSGLEYARAMVDYHQARVSRLRAYVAREEANLPPAEQ